MILPVATIFTILSIQYIIAIVLSFICSPNVFYNKVLQSSSSLSRCNPRMLSDNFLVDMLVYQSFLVPHLNRTRMTHHTHTRIVLVITKTLASLAATITGYAHSSSSPFFSLITLNPWTSGSSINWASMMLSQQLIGSPPSSCTDTDDTPSAPQPAPSYKHHSISGPHY